MRFIDEIDIDSPIEIRRKSVEKRISEMYRNYGMGIKIPSKGKRNVIPDSNR